MRPRPNRTGAPLALIADDDRATRLLIRAALEQAGLEVHEVENGRETVAAFADLAPDVCLLDVAMPVMDGFEACLQIRRLPAGDSVPIMMITGLEDVDSVKRSYELGATDFLTKPINWTLLQQRVRFLLRASRAEEQIREMAFFDRLTGLPNRTLFQERLGSTLKEAWRHGCMVAIIFLDLDRFKQVNDTFGHSMGDRLIRAIADRLTSRIRQTDSVARFGNENCLIGRFGGDEFTVLLSNIKQAADAEALAERLNQVFSKPLVIGNHEIFVRASMGISLYPLDGTDPDELLKYADTAMYCAKMQGGNTYKLYSRSMSLDAFRRLTLENDLRRAIDRQELVLHYQPRVDVKTNRVKGLEALVRWRRPSHGLIPPCDFIPVAEETGLIVPMGEWILREACRQTLKWQQEYSTAVPVSVNLSRVQLNQSSLFETVAGILAETRLSPGLLELEITESSIMENEHGAVSTLLALRKLGVNLAIDDFGTGYASLSFLKRFPLTTLKVDRSFVSDLLQDEENQAITGAILAMARGLGLTTVAEGVECEEQAKWLAKEGCDQIQGYFFSPPLAATEVLKFFLRREAELQPSSKSDFRVIRGGRRRLQGFGKPP